MLRVQRDGDAANQASQKAPEAQCALDNLSLCAEHDNQIKGNARGKRRSDGKLLLRHRNADSSPVDPKSSLVWGSITKRSEMNAPGRDR